MTLLLLLDWGTLLGAQAQNVRRQQKRLNRNTITAN